MNAHVSPRAAALLIATVLIAIVVVAYSSRDRPADTGMKLGAGADLSKLSADQTKAVRAGFEAARAARNAAPSAR